MPCFKPDSGDPARLQELARTDRAAGGDEAETCEALEDDARERIPVADDIGEDADEERLLDEATDDVVIRPQAQKSAASVTSITMSVVARKATSPPSRPNPLSI